MGSNPATPTSYKPHFLGLVSSRGVRSACCIANGSANRDRGWPLRPSGRGVTGELQTGAREASRQCAKCEIRIRLDERVVVCQTGRAHQQVIWRPGEPTLPFLKRVQVGKVGYHGLSAGTIGNPRMSDALAQLTDVAVDVAERDTVTRQVLSWLCVCGYQRAVRWPRFEVGDSEDGAFWTVFLRPRKTRGHLDERPERSATRLTVALKEDACLFDLTGRRSRVSTGAESTVSTATQGAGIGTCRTLDGSLVSVGSTRTPRCRSCVGHEERTRHWPVDPAANTTPSARVLSDATWWVGANRLRVWAIGPVLATDLSGRTGRCTAAQ